MRIGMMATHRAAHMIAMDVYGTIRAKITLKTIDKIVTTWYIIGNRVTNTMLADAKRHIVTT